MYNTGFAVKGKVLSRYRALNGLGIGFIDKYTQLVTTAITAPQLISTLYKSLLKILSRLQPAVTSSAVP
jgi:hypothetical protein